MPEEDKIQNNMVISYTIKRDGETSKEYDRLQQVLQEGWMVVDIISTALPTESVLTSACITVLLINHAGGIPSRYSKATR